MAVVSDSLEDIFSVQAVAVIEIPPLNMWKRSAKQHVKGCWQKATSTEYWHKYIFLFSFVD